MRIYVFSLLKYRQNFTRKNSLNRFRAYWVGQVNWWCSRNFEFWAVCFTAVYIGGSILIMSARFDELLKLDLNEIGDLSAGVFGPVALLWLILGYVQQGKELKLSTTALQLQAQELEKTVEQQVKMVSSQERSLVNYENSIEPLLKALVVYADWDEGVFYCTVSIENFGEYCEFITVYSESKSGVSSSIGLDPLFPNDLDSFRFCGLVEWEDYEVAVEYTARSGIINTQYFDMTSYYDEDNSSYAYAVKKIPFLALSFIRDRDF